MSVLPATLTDIVLDNKLRFFSDIALWPRTAVLNHKAWLGNFKGNDEKKMARHLLNGFLFFSQELLQQISSSSIHALSGEIVSDKNDPEKSRREWRAFLGAVVIVPVPGERPKPADSGNLFARYTRDRFRISEDRVLTHQQALQKLIAQGPFPIIFVDDFVGSGNQFITMWTRKIDTPGFGYQAYSEFSIKNPNWRPFYCPAFATSSGIQGIFEECPAVHVRPGNELTADYSVFHPRSIVWPDDLRSKAEKFVRDVSLRAGIPDTDGGDTDDFRGYRKAGLAIAFAHGVPDSTIPLFTWDQNGWRPLIKK